MAANSLAELNGNFKDQFHKEVVDLLPQIAVLQRGLIPYVASDKMNGEFYSIPTLLRSNQGVSYLGEAGTVTALQDPVAGQMKEAQVYGTEMNVRGQLSYKALSQASAAGAKAFKKAAAWLVEDLTNVAHTRLELAALYGQSGLGTVESVAEITGQTANIVITAATFAPGIWVPLEGAYIDSFTTTTKNNSGTIAVTLVTSSTRTIKVTYSATGGTFVSAPECSAGDILYFKGVTANATSFNEMCGLQKQFSDTSSTLFGLARATYTLAQGNEYDFAGPVSKGKIVDAAMKAVDKGCMSDLVCLVGTKAWAVLAADDMALRAFDSSYSAAKSKSGSRELEYESVNGTIKVICHPMVKWGHAFIFNPKDVLWVGSSKPTFEIPGMSEQFFRLVDGYNSVELQNFSDLAIYALKPCQTVFGSGITY